MRHLASWSLVLGLSAAFAVAVPTVMFAHAAYAKGGGGGGKSGGSTGGKSGGSSGGKSGGKTGGTGSGGAKGGAGGGAGAGAKAGAKSNTSNSKGRGDYLEQMQREEADDSRADFLDDATADVVRAMRCVERGE